MKGKEQKKEVKKEKLENKTKVLSEYQKEKQSRSNKGMPVTPKS